MQPSYRNDEQTSRVTVLRRITRIATLGLVLAVFASPAWAKGSCDKTDMKACKAMCAKKDATSCIRLSMLYLDNNDKLARLTMEKGCKLKSAEACFYAATFAEVGRGEKKDPERAAKWLETSCKLKDSGACSKRAEMLYEQDRKPESVKWYAAACKLGDLYMCGSLGQMEVQGDGIPQDGKRGVGRLERVCDAGIGHGCTEAGVAWYKGEVEGKKDIARAMKLFTKGCNAKESDERSCTFASAISSASTTMDLTAQR